MKKLLTLGAIALSASLLLTGCESPQGSGTKPEPNNASVRQQLMDLMNARNAGVITEAEYQAQRNRLLGQ